MSTSERAFHHPFRLGLTGGIGAGKSLVASLLAAWGIPTYDTDAVAKSIMSEDTVLREAIIARFGMDIYIGKELQRAVLAEKVFGKPDELAALNAIVHPGTIAHFEEWCANLAEAGAKWVVKEAAILYESGAYVNCDAVCVVTALENLRIERVLSRGAANGQIGEKVLTEAQIRERMARQWPESEKIKRADWVIINDNSHALLPQVQELKLFIEAKLSVDL